LVQEKTMHANQIQKVLETANIKLASVANDVLGKSGRLILSQICEGREDAAALASLAKGVLKKKESELTRALTGRVRDHHRYMLKLHLEIVTDLEKRIEDLSKRIEQRMKEEQEKEGSQFPFVEAVRLLKTVPGISDRTAQIVLGEIGLDMGRFPSAGHLSSWAGLAPGMNTSGERVQRAGLRNGNGYVKGALVQAAWVGIKKKGSSLHDLFCRVARRGGKKKAICAVAHSLLASIYQMLKTGAPYEDLGQKADDVKQTEKTKRNAIKRLESLGYKVQLATA